jgi:RHS repeat-associated protein
VSSTSNELTGVTGTLTRSYSYDAAGHTTGYATLGFTYNDRGRVGATSAGSTDYLYNALGQMIEKSGTGGTTVFMQDESGHLLGEYNGSGSLIEETIWLGDVPVATLQPNGSGGVNIYYVHTDHLNAPRKVAQPTTGTLAWRWDTDPFGTAAPNQNPAGLGTFAYNLRFPGQYFQAETGLNQNVNRDYDPLGGGRYIEADPIGLRGGSLSLYSYVRNDPLFGIDPLGLADMCPSVVTAVGGIAGGALGYTCGCVLGGVLGATGGTLVAPGVGTVGGAVGGCGAGGTMGGAAGAALGALAGNAVAGQVCGSEPDCTRATPFHLAAAGITDPEEFKADYVGKGGGKFDICACKDGSIQLKAVGQCGMKGPSIPTHARWK